MLRSSTGRERGFTLTELAVVFAIVALLLAAGLFTLSAQTDVRNFEETRRRLEMARELLLAFALVNGRLPCPATTSGAEAITTPPNCDATYGGFLPAQAIGFQIVDGNGFAIDAWGNRIRYAVSSTTPTCTPAATATPHFTNAANLRTNGLTCLPNDLLVCNTATGISATDCAAAANQVTNKTTLVAILLATGKNGIAGSGGIDEAANVNGDRVFVWHTPTPPTATNGEFDDQMAWIAVGELYARLVAANLLP
jgi:prepilin-type N-terminal cleavage/methylation domain-containing protein